MAIKESTKETLRKVEIGWCYDRKHVLWATLKVDTIFNSARHIRQLFHAVAMRIVEKVNGKEKCRKNDDLKMIFDSLSTS